MDSEVDDFWANLEASDSEPDFSGPPTPPPFPPVEFFKNRNASLLPGRNIA